MKRKQFLSKGVIGMGSVLGLTSLFASQHRNREGQDSDYTECFGSPKETRGPFPNKTPAQYVRENIVGNRIGIPLLMKFTILNKNENCRPYSNALVDVWHCDSHGKYSEYGGNRMQPEDLSDEHFLRGRLATDANGLASFISIFPGHYPGRSPHIHLEVMDQNEKSLLVTQVAFPEHVCNAVYVTNNYKDANYTSNESDSIFRNSLENNMADSITGDLQNGFTLEKSIVVIS